MPPGDYLAVLSRAAASTALRELELSPSVPMCSYPLSIEKCTESSVGKTVGRTAPGDARDKTTNRVVNRLGDALKSDVANVRFSPKNPSLLDSSNGGVNEIHDFF